MSGRFGIGNKSVEWYTPKWIFVFSRTDSRWMQKCMAAANGFLFFAGRIAFDPGLENMHKKERSGAGSCMLAFGKRALSDLRKLEHHGILISTRK